MKIATDWGDTRCNFQFRKGTIVGFPPIFLWKEVKIFAFSKMIHLYLVACWTLVTLFSQKKETKKANFQKSARFLFLIFGDCIPRIRANWFCTGKRRDYLQFWEINQKEHQQPGFWNEMRKRRRRKYGELWPRKERGKPYAVPNQKVWNSTLVR